MERKFLEELGLEKEAIDAILDAASKDIGKQLRATEKAQQERDALQGRLAETQAKLQAMGGVNVAEMQARLQQLTQDMAQQESQHQAALARVNQEAQTAAFMAGKRFVNSATRDYYAAKLNHALSQPQSAGKDREDLLSELLTGQDGKPLENVFLSENPNPVLTLPPVGAADGGGLDQGTFAKMTYRQRLALKQESPEAYHALTGATPNPTKES